MIKLILGLRTLKRIELSFNDNEDEEPALGVGYEVFEFRHVKFEMSVKYPSNVFQHEIGYMHL